MKTTIGQLKNMIKEGITPGPVDDALRAIHDRFKGRVRETAVTTMVQDAILADHRLSGEWPTYDDFMAMMAATDDSEDHERLADLVARFPSCVDLFESLWQLA